MRHLQTCNVPSHGLVTASDGRKSAQSKNSYHLLGYAKAYFAIYPIRPPVISSWNWRYSRLCHKTQRTTVQVLCRASHNESMIMQPFTVVRRTRWHGTSLTMHLLRYRSISYVEKLFSHIRSLRNGLWQHVICVAGKCTWIRYRFYNSLYLDQIVHQSIVMIPTQVHKSECLPTPAMHSLILQSRYFP